MPPILPRAFGIVCFIGAVFLLLVMYQDAHSGAWFTGMLNGLIWQAVAFLVVLGLCGLFYANRLERTDREAALVLGLGTAAEKKDDEEEQNEEI